jgi:ABC-type Mn2+/Zn2+ transport system permease subunit
MEVLTDPYSWWLDPFVSNPFMRNALWVGLLVVLSTSVVGTWVVLRGMSFLGDALAHGVLPGIAVAFILGINTSLGAFVAALVMVLGVNLIRAHSPLPEDTSVGVLFVGFLALAVVLMSHHSAGYAGDLNRFLFGSIIAVDNGDLLRQGAAALVSLLGVALFFRAFLVLTFDETQARLLGLRPRLAHGVLLVLLTVSIVGSFEAVGSLLVFAFLVAPPASAALLVRRVPVIMMLSVGLGSISVVVGLLISYHAATATSATMALVSVAIFVAVLVANSVHSFVVSALAAREISAC